MGTRFLDTPRNNPRNYYFEFKLTLLPASYFLEQAGLDTDKAFDFALGQYGINMAGVFGAWFLMTLGIGRRRVSSSTVFRLRH